MAKWIIMVLLLVSSSSSDILLQLHLQNWTPISLQVGCIDLHSCGVAWSCVPWIWYAVQLIDMQFFPSPWHCVCYHSLLNTCSLSSAGLEQYGPGYTVYMYVFYHVFWTGVYSCSLDTFPFEPYRFVTLCWKVVAALFILLGIFLILNR